MRTHIFYSGQARTFSSCFPNQAWYILRHMPNPIFWVSVAKDDNCKAMELLKEKFNEVHIEYVEQPTFIEKQDVNNFSGYGRSASVQNVYRAFWHYQKVWDMTKNNVWEGDICLRIRPDLWFQEFEMPTRPKAHECIVPPWGSYGGINDRLALMGAKAAKAYMTAFSVLDKLLAFGCPLHPETLTRAAVESDDCAVFQNFVTEFKIRRLPDANHGNKEWLVPEPILGIELLRAALTKYE